MIEEIEGLHAELQRVALFRHAKVFMRREVPEETAEPDQRVPAGIAEMVDRLQGDCCRVDRAVAVFYEHMVMVERDLGRIQEELRLG